MVFLRLDVGGGQTKKFRALFSRKLKENNPDVLRAPKTYERSFPTFNLR